MASLITHTFIGISGAFAIKDEDSGKKLWILAIISALLPDIDILGMYLLDIPYDDIWGHRGIIHSLLFAFVWAFLVSTVFFRDQGLISANWFKYLVTFFIITASHPLLDSITDGGLGPALFQPFSDERIFLPWRVLAVSPIGVKEFFTEWGIRVMKSELIYVWSTAVVLALITRALRAIISKRKNNRAIEKLS